MEALLGRNRRTSVGILALAVVLAVASQVLLTVAAPLVEGTPTQTRAAFVAFHVVLLGLVAAVAYANDGLVVCWMASVPVQVVATTGPSPTRTVFRIALPALLVGTVGYVLGRAVRL